MKIPFPIIKTIDSRRSARSYKMIEVDVDVIESVKDFAQLISVPFEHNVQIRFFKSEPKKTLYMTMKSPPDNVAFVAETDVVSISKVGFIGELLILFAQSKGLSTCWYGHYKLSELERLMPHLQTFKRKEIKELLENSNDYDKLSGDVMYALNLGKKAPSAANSQMWKFAFGDNFKTIIVSMPIGYKHFKWEHPNVDIGICACHIWLGLIDKGYNPKVTLSEDSGRAVWRISI